MMFNFFRTKIFERDFSCDAFLDHALHDVIGFRPFSLFFYFEGSFNLFLGGRTVFERARSCVRVLIQTSIQTARQFQILRNLSQKQRNKYYLKVETT